MLLQIVLTTLTLLATWCSQDSRVQVQKWAPIFGLLAQPLWLYTSLVNSQWGILFLTFVFTYIWFKGLRNHWINKE